MKNRYLMIKHYVMPDQSSDKSNMKDYGTKGKKLLDERIMFTNDYNKKYNDYVQSSYIIDLKEIKVVKNRYDVSEQEILTHYLKEYKKEILNAFKDNNFKVDKDE